MNLFKFFSLWILFYPSVLSAVITSIDPIPEVEEAQQATRLSKDALSNQEALKGLHNQNPSKDEQQNIATDLNELRNDQQEPKRPENSEHGGEDEFPERPNKRPDPSNEAPDEKSNALPKYVEEKVGKRSWGLARVWKSMRRGFKKFFRWLKTDITSHKYWVEREPIPIPAGNDDGSSELQDLRVLGNELQSDYETRKLRWIHHDLPNHHNSLLNIELLSNPTFLELVIQYTKEYNQAKIHQDQVKRIWKDLVYLFGNENHARDVLKKIEDYYRKVFPKFERNLFGIDFYSKMHNPLLLPTTKESERVNWQKIFEQEKIAIGPDEKTMKPKSLILLELCQEYRGYVDLWRKAMDSGRAIKVYLNSIKELTYEETRYPNQVIEKFRDLFPNRFNFAEGITDDIREKLLADFPNMSFA
ncbi:uncharacterized protein MELLADRAFT_111501 [Melampsora larici-populina 98AG31]|uniref:Secreted protein n=1 Tax=Melampsora larici-populina (strain 98AG31 / pathotype 3-4-7) TaxID=747676 RepID=F4S3D8_MELLP|nr:uncharacterized protein MELLADRAFT_111501 [Melampsora larici-populina 98AG31]EGG00795.1 hypothetical protein MELLADRAFT_111501 [Melampsora larici-populina 98AG31]